MGAARAGRCAMPVLFARLERDGVAALHVAGALAPSLHADAAGDDEQPLCAGVKVPVRTRTLVELDVVNVDRHRCIVGREPFDACRTDECVWVGRAHDGL
jgi:hypothetical protein